MGTCKCYKHDFVVKQRVGFFFIVFHCKLKGYPETNFHWESNSETKQETIKEMTVNGEEKSYNWLKKISYWLQIA